MESMQILWFHWIIPSFDGSITLLRHTLWIRVQGKLPLVSNLQRLGWGRSKKGGHPRWLLDRYARLVVCMLAQIAMTQPTKVAGTLRRAVRNPAFAGTLGKRELECA
jgi:hypothetical protein